MRAFWIAAIVLAATLRPAPLPAASNATAAFLSEAIFDRWVTIGTADGLPSQKVFAVLVDGQRVWAGTDKGLALLEGDRIRVFGVGDGLPFPVVTALAVSPATGDLWVGTMGGLARLSGGRIDAFTQLDSGLANDVVYGVAASGADVWVATAAGLSRFDTSTGAWEIFDTSNTLMHEPWTYAVTADAGTVYVAVWGGGVVVRDAQTGDFREHRDPDGELEIDLFRDDGLVHDVVSAVSIADGVMWVGTYFGLSRYAGRRWQSFNQDDSGLASDFINFVKADGDAVWIATDQGLSRFDSHTWYTWQRATDGAGVALRITGPDGSERLIPLSTGPASDMVYGIDVAGADIWLATAAGLSHGIATPRTAPYEPPEPETNQGVGRW
ncbi:MAG: regulator [Acidobacteriota bacterium]|jgi:ligand-binding sensor domain-containing protein